jgi:hypothetical protein
MGPDDALAITTGVWALAALAALSIAIPQSWRLIRTSMRHDSLWWFRLMSVLLFGALGVAMLRNVAVWADLTFNDQRLLGPISQRWPFDLGIATGVMIACVYAAVLYVQTQREVLP